MQVGTDHMVGNPEICPFVAPADKTAYWNVLGMTSGPTCGTSSIYSCENAAYQSRLKVQVRENSGEPIRH